MLNVLAQTGSETMPLWAQIAGGIASLGFAVWYAWFTTTTTIPRLQEAAKQERDSILAEFRAEAKEQRAAESRRAEQSFELAKSGHKAMDQVVRAVDDLRKTLHDVLPHNAPPTVYRADS